MRGLVIAGTHSGCGKTTATIGILTALKKKGLAAQPFKAGPDFIDAGLYRLITNRPSRNLDIWMCGKEYVVDCFHKYSAEADIAIVEGVMGLYDGEFSTARLAGLLNLPVILVVDAYGMAESAGAMIKGFRDWELLAGNKTINMTGIIFNRVASENHYRRLKNCVRDIDVLGYLPRNLDFEIPHRHLGLVVAEENPISPEKIEQLAEAVIKHINIDTLLDMAGSNGVMEKWNNSSDTPRLQYSDAPTIAIAYDKAFCFYYEDNLDLLRDTGAEIVTFSPISDSSIPECADAIYIGGGYPELYAEELSRNTSMLEAIHDWAHTEKPLYAECGGLMYLSQGIHDFEGNFFKMARVFPFETLMRKGLSYLGYREITVKEDCIVGKKGNILRGHEFHYSEIRDKTQNTEERIQKEIYSVRDNNRHDFPDEGYKFKNTIASYIHIHFGSNPGIARNFAGFIKKQ